MELTEKEYNSLVKIIDYGIDVAMKHFKECNKEDRKNHIFNDYLDLFLAIKEIEMKSN